MLSEASHLFLENRVGIFQGHEKVTFTSGYDNGIRTRDKLPKAHSTSNTSTAEGNQIMMQFMKDL